MQAWDYIERRHVDSDATRWVCEWTDDPTGVLDDDDRDLADLQRRLDELVGAVMRCDAAAWLRDSLQAAKDRDALRALAARIKTTQPKEPSDV